MKKIGVYLFVMLFCMVFGFAQEKSSAIFEDNPLKKIKLAKELAEYGYEAESPSALLQATEILLEVHIRKSETQSMQNEAAMVASQSGFSFDVDTLFSDAKDFAGKDETFSRWIKKIERRFSGTRGLVNGPEYVRGFVYGNDGNFSHTFPFKQGEQTHLCVFAKGDTNLDIDIYDASGKIVASGKGNDTIDFIPEKTGNYIVQISNRTRFNVSYTLFTN